MTSSNRRLLRVCLLAGVLAVATTFVVRGLRRETTPSQSLVNSADVDQVSAQAETQPTIAATPAPAATQSVSPALTQTPPAATPGPLTPVETQQLAIAREILKAGADNDPRMDRDLKKLSPALRAQLREDYKAVANESRNSKGTMVFLLGRNLETTQDMSFMGDVVAEDPCLSLADCTRPPNPADSSGHHEGGTAIVLAYPQIVALQAIAREFERGMTPEMLSAARDVVDRAMRSRSPEVVRVASELNKKIN